METMKHLDSLNRQQIVDHLLKNGKQSLLSKVMDFLYEYEDVMCKISHVELSLLFLDDIYEIYQGKFKKKYAEKCRGNGIITHVWQHMSIIKRYYRILMNCKWNIELYFVHEGNYSGNDFKFLENPFGPVVLDDSSANVYCKETPAYTPIKIAEYLEKKYKFIAKRKETPPSLNNRTFSI